MVSLGDLSVATSLSTEKQTITRAIRLFETGGHITSLEVAPEGSLIGVTVSVAGMTYPTAMTNQIKTSLAARLDVINKELEALGITVGQEASPQVTKAPPPGPAGAATAAAAAAAARARRG